MGRNQLRSGKWAGGLKAGDPECGLKCGMGSTFGPSGAGNRQGRTRVWPSEAQNPRTVLDEYFISAISFLCL